MELAINKRDISGKANKQLRKDGVIPAIVYGKHLSTPVTISLQKNDFIKAYNEAGFSTPITIKGDDMNEMVLIHDLQVDPVTDYVLHVDFYAIKKDQKVTTEVPVLLTGISPIAKTGDARVQQVKDAIAIEALPADLPHDITIDISKLTELHDVVFVKDLDFGDKVEVLDDPDTAVVTVVALSDAEPEEEEDLSAEAASGEKTAEDEEEKKDDA